jgi:hypothetical protein
MRGVFGGWAQKLRTEDVRLSHRADDATDGLTLQRCLQLSRDLTPRWSTGHQVTRVLIEALAGCAGATDRQQELGDERHAVFEGFLRNVARWFAL